jgi:beta-lactam-binding protein with PASTA domain
VQGQRLARLLQRRGAGQARRLNEVEVPNVLGESFDDATAQLSSAPLRSQAIFKPATPGQPVGVVLGEIPTAGSHLMPLDTVRLVLAKPLHGVVPDVVGLPLAKALHRLDARGVKADVGGLLADGSGSERVVSQAPRAGVAAAPGMTVKLFMAR